MQEACALAIRWHGEGRRDAHLYMRVWGDLKSKYGAEWRKSFAVTRGSRPTNPDHELVYAYRYADDEVRKVRHAHRGYLYTSVIHNDPRRAITIDVSDRPGPDADAVMDVRAAVAKLTPAQRHVVEQCSFRGRSQAVVAAEKGVSEQAVKLLLMRARRSLAVMLKEYGDA